MTIGVSADFNTAIKATIRKFRGKVEITWTDSLIDPTISASANDENYAHSLASDLIGQTADNKEAMTHKWAHLDGVQKLDGTYFLAPGSNAAAPTAQFGWWGATRCNGSSVWPGSNPLLTITFAARALYGFVVTGDNQYGEYPVSFIAKVFTLSGDGSPVLTETVTDGVGTGWERVNVLEGDTVAVRWRKTLDEGDIIGSCEKITLEVVKWSAPDRIVKISEFYSSVVETYEGDDIVSFDILEENLIADGTIPTGNISANEMSLKLQNVENRFFWGNTDSPLHTLLIRNRRIKVWIGIEINPEEYEYILMGTFFSGDWQAEELGTTASTNARDRMELLRTNIYEISPLSENITLYALAVLVLDDAILKIPDLVYNIDTNLLNYTLDYAWFDKVSYFECIKLIAGASQSRAYIDRFDVLQIETEL